MREASDFSLACMWNHWPGKASAIIKVVTEPVVLLFCSLKSSDRAS